jgi:hypothetical protein
VLAQIVPEVAHPGGEVAVGGRRWKLSSSIAVTDSGSERLNHCLSGLTGSLPPPEHPQLGAV